MFRRVSKVMFMVNKLLAWTIVIRELRRFDYTRRKRTDREFASRGKPTLFIHPSAMSDVEINQYKSYKFTLP